MAFVCISARRVVECAQQRDRKPILGFRNPEPHYGRDIILLPMALRVPDNLSSIRRIHLIVHGVDEQIQIPIVFGPPSIETDFFIPTFTSSTTIGLRLSHCGDLGKALILIEQDFIESVGHMPSCCHIKRHHSQVDPLVVLTLHFGVFRQPDHHTLNNRARTTIYDWNTRHIDSQGEEQFDEIRHNGFTMNCGNIAQIVQAGDVIRRIAIKVENPINFGSGIGLTVSVYKMWLDISSRASTQQAAASTSQASVAVVRDATTPDGQDSTTV